MKLKISLADVSLRRRVCMAIALVSLLPLIVLFYYFSGNYISFWVTVILAVIIFLGWQIVFEIFSSIVKIYTHSKDTLEKIGEKVPSVSDEIQSLENMISLLSDKVKSGFKQLRDFTRMTEDLNKEVSRTMLVLSTIFQANDLFSKKAPAQDVIKLIINHLKHLVQSEVCFCSLEGGAGGKFETISSININDLKVKSFLEQKAGEFSQIKGIIIWDRRNKPKKYSQWAQDLGVENIAIVPVSSKERIVGLIGVGNNVDDHSFSKDDLEVLSLFSQNITLIWEHEKLSAKIEELEIVDYLTGLYNQKLIVKRLDEEIKRATIYQRPCGFIAVRIINYDDYRKKQGVVEAEKCFRRIAKAFETILKPVDIAGRIGPNTLGAILIESNKRQSQEVADNLKKNLAQLCGDEVKLSFSVAESPIHGVTAREIMLFAQKDNGA